jgi:catalase (peroxidase I)
MVIKADIELDEQDFKAAKEMMDELINVDYFGKISYDCFVLLEKVLQTIRKAEENQKIKEGMKRKAGSYEWQSDRCVCGHTAHDHALMGTTLCILEGCRCELFKEKK